MRKRRLPANRLVRMLAERDMLTQPDVARIAKLAEAARR
jgi:hypothetical protein